MPKIIILLVLALHAVSGVSFAINDNVLIKQGAITINFADIDGFSYSIPTNIQADFFDSTKRIDSTLKTMLTMKHVVGHAIANNLLDKEIINSNVSKYLIENTKAIAQTNLTDMEFIKLKQYLVLKMSYKYMQKYIRDSVKDEELSELAREEYIVTKQNYFQKHTRDINYVHINYTEANKQQQLQLAQKIQQRLLENKLDFDKTAKDYESSTDVEFIQGINDFHYNEKYKLFSDFIFQADNIGLIDDIQGANNRFMVAVITKISPEGYKDFTEVKNQIVAKLKKAKVTRKFGDLVLQLTQDPVEINENAIISLKTRYLAKTAQE